MKSSPPSDLADPELSGVVKVHLDLKCESLDAVGGLDERNWLLWTSFCHYLVLMDDISIEVQSDGVSFTYITHQV